MDNAPDSDLTTESKNAQILDEFAICPICFEVYQEPKTLTCLHRFCESCLQGFISALDKKQIARNKGFNCPVCKELILPPCPKKNIADWASLFKTDFHLKSLINYVQTNLNKEESKVQRPCKYLHKPQKRNHFCVDCREVVCEVCLDELHKDCGLHTSLDEAAADLKATADAWLREITPKLEDATVLEALRERHCNKVTSDVSSVRKTIQEQAERLRQQITEEEGKLLGQLDKWHETEQFNISLEALKFDDSVTPYREKVSTLLCWLKSRSALEMVTNCDVSFSLNDLSPAELDLRHYNQFVQSLGNLNISYQTAASPSCNLGSIKILKPNY